MNWGRDASCWLHDALGGDTRKECFRLKKHYTSLFFAQKPLFGPVWARSQWRSSWRPLVAVSFSDGGDAATFILSSFLSYFIVPLGPMRVAGEEGGIRSPKRPWTETPMRRDRDVGTEPGTGGCASKKPKCTCENRIGTLPLRVGSGPCGGGTVCQHLFGARPVGDL